MFPIPDCRSTGLHFLLAIAFGIAEFPVNGNTILANKTCLNVSDGIICYFKGSEILMNWNEATHLCRSFDSTLLVIRNENDQVAVADYISSNINNTEAWTAGKDFAFSRPTWTWINGEPFKDVGEEVEEKQDSQNYIKKENAALEANYIFTARVASDKLPYICQHDVAYCNFPSDMNVTEKCLRLIGDSQSWYDARNHCLMTNGDLAIIGDAELGILKSLKLNESFWIGLMKKSFRWTRNDDVESYDVTYTNWDNTFAMDGECIAIDASKGTWKAIGCGVEKRVVVCQRGQGLTSPAATTDAPAEPIHTFTRFVVVGVGIIVAICIIVIVVFLRRTKDRRSEQSKHNDGYVKNNREELDVRITNALVYTSINEPADVPVNESDDIRGVYADIALITEEQSEDGGTNQQPGIVYASLDFNKDPTNQKPDKTHATSPTKVGPLGDIYAVPDVKGNSVSSPGDKSPSHSVKVTPQGDVYAIPMKMSTSPNANTPVGSVYANLQTATLDKEQMAENNGETM